MPDRRDEYLQMVAGGRIAGDILRLLGRTPGNVGGVMGQLVGQLVKRRTRTTPAKGRAKPRPTPQRAPTGARLAPQFRKEPRAPKGKKTQSQTLEEIYKESPIS